MVRTARTSKRAQTGAEAAGIDPPAFRRKLMAWYRLHARVLPWRETTDPYRIWVSEIMLQQTRVAAVVEHYHEFLRRFPTLVALALATESDVLAAWSGLGYYRRARMLHKAAQFIVTERLGALPATSLELRTLPGIGEYTAAAIASIAFGESVAVVDGNVERVILRLTGEAEQKGAATRALVRDQAQALIPPRKIVEPARAPDYSRHIVWDTQERLAIATAAHPDQPAAGLERSPSADPDELYVDEASPSAVGSAAPAARPRRVNAAGDHNQAMMELGATICLPRAPLCLNCPVYALCRTRGEHATPPRPAQLSRPVAFLLETRKSGPATDILLERRPAAASLMPGMFELPPLPLDSVEGREPVLRVRHAITGTNYYVQVYASSGRHASGEDRRDAVQLRHAVPTSERDLEWVRTSRLPMLPLTGLARKVLQRLKIMEGADIELLK